MPELDPMKRIGRAASGGALGPEPPRATAVGPQSLRFSPFPGGNC